MEITTLNSFFIFNRKYYKQIHDVAMNSPFNPTLANVLVCQFEEQCMFDCLIGYKPISYKRYIDGTLLLLSSELQVTKFSNYMNFKHRNIFWPSILRRAIQLHTSVYRRPTFSGVLTNSESLLLCLICIYLKRHLDKIFTRHQLVCVVPKKELLCVFPFLSKIW